MDFELNGGFLIPKGAVLEDLGGKAQRLIEYQNLAQKHGFRFPDAVALPWQIFAGIPIRKGIEYDYGFKRYDNDFSFTPGDFNDAEREVVLEVLSWIKNPFFSSSAPGEDSFKARMPGAYSSRHGESLESMMKDRGPRIENHELSAEEEHLAYNLSQLGEVLASYFFPFPTGLRKKHGIPDSGMGVLVRETVGGERGPSYSIVIQTNLPDGVYVGVAKGYGENIVSGREHDSYKFNPEKGTFDGAIENYPFDLEKIVQMVLSFEKDLNLPIKFGGDYELALDRDLNVYLLQCPPLKKIKDIGAISDKGNYLKSIQTPRGSAVVRFNRIVYIPEGIYIGDESTPKEHRAEEAKLQELFQLNQSLTNYLLIVRSIPRLWIPEIAYNAAGIIEFVSETGRYMLSPLGDSPVSHYTTFLRTEKIGFVPAVLKDEFEGRIAGKQGLGNRIAVLETPGTFKVNEFRNQAGLYLR